MLIVYKPTIDDMWFRRKMLEDEETMSYNHAWGGAIPFPKEDWKEWYDAWLKEGNKDRYYRYLKEENGDFKRNPYGNSTGPNRLPLPEHFLKMVAPEITHE